VTERQGLIRKAEKFLESARVLMDSGDLDSAVSRIYYAAFFVAEALLDALGLSFSSHKSVISSFGQEFSKKDRLDSRFHRFLIVAFEKRQQADYGIETGLDREEVSELLEEARAFMKAGKGWLTKKGFLKS